MNGGPLPLPEVGYDRLGVRCDSGSRRPSSVSVESRTLGESLGTVTCDGFSVGSYRNDIASQSGLSDGWRVSRRLECRMERQYRGGPGGWTQVRNEGGKGV